jgi:hypothetical protein
MLLCVHVKLSPSHTRKTQLEGVRERVLRRIFGRKREGKSEGTRRLGERGTHMSII